MAPLYDGDSNNTTAMARRINHTDELREPESLSNTNVAPNGNTSPSRKSVINVGQEGDKAGQTFMSIDADSLLDNSIRSLGSSVGRRNSSSSAMPKKSALRRRSSYDGGDSVHSLPLLPSQIGSAADEAAGLPTIKRKVSLGQIKIREYERVLGDNPSCTRGPPVSIGWAYNELHSMKIEDYEKNKPTQEARTLQQMQLPQSVRESIIKEFSPTTSRTDIQRAMKEINITKQRRRTSVAAQEVEGVHIVVESASRKIKRLLGMRPKKKQEMNAIYRKAENYKFSDCSLDTSSHKAINIVIEPSAINDKIEEDRITEEAKEHNNDAVTLAQNGDYNAALKSFKEANELFKRSLGNNNTVVATTLYNIGNAYDRMNEWTDALASYEEALSIYRSCNGDNRVYIADVLYSVGHLHLKLKQYDKSLGRHYECLAIRLEVLGEDHPLVQKSREDIDAAKKFQKLKEGNHSPTNQNNSDQSNKSKTKNSKVITAVETEDGDDDDFVA